MVTVFSRALEIELQSALATYAAQFATMPGQKDRDDERWRNCLADLCDHRDCAICAEALRGKFGAPFKTLIQMRRDRRSIERTWAPHQMPRAHEIEAIARIIEQLHARVVESLRRRGA